MALLWLAKQTYMNGPEATFFEIRDGMLTFWHDLTPLRGALVAVAGWVLILVGRALWSPLRDVPGPFIARFTDLWYLWRVYHGHFEEENLELHKKYGPIVRLGPNRYSLADPAGLKAVYGPAAAKTFPKSPAYHPASPPDRTKWTLFADDDIARHARNRRLFQSTYSMSSLVTYETYVDECADLFSLRLAELASAGVPADMGYWFQCFAFDVIGLITYSKRLGFLDQGDDIGDIIKTIDDEMVYFTLVGVYSWLHKLFFPIRNWLAGNKGTGRTYLMNFTKERVTEHKTAPKGVTTEDAEARKVPLDFLSKFLNMNAADPTNFTMYHVLAGCASNIVAGSDTTATTLSGVLYHLLKNPITLRRLKVEIELMTSQVAEGTGKRPVTWTEAQGMPYLQAVIKEALRLHTAVSLPMERVVAPGGVEIGGLTFPEGTFVGINNWVYHRSKDIFGKDADEFKPERWFTEDPAQLSIMNKNMIAFGAGARTCIGRHIASLQISKLIPTLVRDFDFTLCEDISGPSRHWATKNYFFLKPTNFRVGVALKKTVEEPSVQPTVVSEEITLPHERDLDHSIGGKERA